MRPSRNLIKQLWVSIVRYRVASIPSLVRTPLLSSRLFSLACMVQLRRRESSAAVAALVDFSMARPTFSNFPSLMHTISPLPALDRTVVNISKNYRGPMESMACTEFQTPTLRRDGFLSPPTKPKHSSAVASLLSRPDSRFTPLSNFPSRVLPLPGVSPQCLDKAEDEYFGVLMLVLTPGIHLIPHNS